MNEYIAAAVDELYLLGIRDIVISPGSRSTTLSMLFCEHKFNVYLNIDERSAGFFALGIAKEKKCPVVLVCTSGSAVAHYLPAMTEAKQSRIPIIILSADRPPELQNVGAPQTINQKNILGEFVNYFEELSIPRQEDFVYPRIVMQKAYLKCLALPRGPVQINIPLREPLVPDLLSLNFEEGRFKNQFEFYEGETIGKCESELFSSFFANRNGIIVCGGDVYSNYQKEIILLGERLKAPVLADPLSNVRNYKSRVIIDSYDAFLQDESIREELMPDYILLFGQPPVSKRLQQFLIKNCKSKCYHIDDVIEYRNPSLTTSKFINVNPRIFAESTKIENDNDLYLKKWENINKLMRKQLSNAKSEEYLFEGKIVQLIQDLLPPESRLVVANSMSIRDVDYFFESKNKNIKILCNRGTNGIDGTISTALGISTSNYPTVLLTGDLAFFHDMNGLLIAKTHKLKLTIVVLNNNGGGIFQYLPQKGQKYFDYLFTTQHDIDFQGVGYLYGVKYSVVKDYNDFRNIFMNSLISDDGIQIIEVKINMERSFQLHEKYTNL